MCGQSAPITGIGKLDQAYNIPSTTAYETDGTGAITYINSSSISGASGDLTWYGLEDPDNLGFPNIRADLSEATAAGWIITGDEPPPRYSDLQPCEGVVTLKCAFIIST